MLFFLETVDVVAILLMLFMLVVILNQQPSKAQMAFVLYNVFTIIFVIGLQLELMHSDTVGEALSGLCVQYVGQAGFLMALLWFVSVFARFSIPAWIYGVQGLCSTFVLVGIFTAEKHSFFYSSMEILTDGLYNRIEVEGGVLWYLHYIQLYRYSGNSGSMCRQIPEKFSCAEKADSLYCCGDRSPDAGAFLKGSRRVRQL